MNKEPALILGGVVSALVALLIAFGVIDIERGRALEAFLTALVVAAPLLQGWLTRRKVYSPATVERIRASAVAQRRPHNY